VRAVALAAALALCAAGAALAGAPLTFADFIAMGRVSAPAVSPDGKSVVYVVTRYDLETNKGDSDLYLSPVAGGPERRLTIHQGRDDQPAFSPDGEWIAFTSSRSGDAQIWLLPTAGGEARQLTTLSTGASHPIWTRDGKHLVFRSRVYPDCPDDDCNKKRVAEDASSAVKARIFEGLFYVHWDAFRDDRRSHVFIMPVEGGTARDLTPGPHEVPTIALGSAHDVAVSPDGAEICVVAHAGPDRAWSTNNDLFVVSTRGGEWRRITENPANDNHPVYSPDGRTIAYRAMARAGFEADRYRVMLYDRESGAHREVAPTLASELDRSPDELAWSSDSRRLYLVADDQGTQSLFMIDVKGGRVRRLTEERYVANVSVARDGKRLVFLSQHAAMPYEVFTSDANGGKIAQVSRINAEILARVEMNPLEPFWYDGAGGNRVHGWLLKPPGFDPARKYPLVFLVHGGPQGAWSDSFHWRWNYQMFASPGYVIAAVNPRGSTGFGQRFTDEISRDWGGKVYEDLMKGLDHVLATYDFVDPARVAAAGASYGGYMMAWFLGHTDRFVCLVNHDGVYNLESMYGATEELWFPEWEFGGTPWERPGDYEKYSPHRYAQNFKTPTLVVHGALDYRVPLTQAQELFTALQRQGVPSKFLFFPDEGHWVLKPQNAQLWWETVLGWIGEYTGE
jgi:dipeptidyl aminopeptidase/acylaminoacyl peptidase